MSLKDLTQQDIDNVFFNTDEFAEPHMINDVSANVIVGNDQLMHRSKQEFGGISIGEILIYVRKTELELILKGQPKEGSPLIFDNRQMIIFNSREDEGVYEIVLQQNKGM